MDSLHDKPHGESRHEHFGHLLSLLEQNVLPGSLTFEEAEEGRAFVWKECERVGKLETPRLSAYSLARGKAVTSAGRLGDDFGARSLDEESQKLLSALQTCEREALIAESEGLVEGCFIVELSSLQKLVRRLLDFSGKLWWEKGEKEVRKTLLLFRGRGKRREASAREKSLSSGYRSELRPAFEDVRDELVELCRTIYREPTSALRSLEKELLPLYLRPAAQRPPGQAAPTYAQGLEEERRFSIALKEISSDPARAGRLRGRGFLSYQTHSRRKALKAARTSLAPLTERYLSLLTSTRGEEERQRRMTPEKTL